MDSHPVAFFLFINGEQTRKPWFPSSAPCPTPVCSAPVSWQIIEGYKSTILVHINNLPVPENKQANLVDNRGASWQRNKVSRESLGTGSLAPSAVHVCCCFKKFILGLASRNTWIEKILLFFFSNSEVKDSQVSWVGCEAQIQPSIMVTKATAYY